MRRINRWTNAARAAERWRAAYEGTALWEAFGGTHRPTHEALLRLGANPHPDDVDDVIGNTSWTDVPCCDECEQIVEEVVCVGDDPADPGYGADYDHHTAYLCLACVLKALTLLDSSE